MHRLETVIIGGGIAGLACARRLHDCGRDFRLITDRLGGRMYAGEGPVANFGATYVTSDYRQLGPYVGRGRRITFAESYFWDRDRFLNLYHPRNLRHTGALLRLYPQLIAFRLHLNRLRRRVPHVCQAELLRADSKLTGSVAESASQFIKNQGLEELDEIFIGPIVNSTVFVPSRDVNTFYYLACLMPILLPTYLADFSETLARLTRDYRHKILLDRVERLELPARSAAPCARYLVATGRQVFRAEHVVVATPCHNTRLYCPELDQAAAEGIREIPCCTLHVQGRRRPEFLPGKTVFQRPGQTATVLLPLDAHGRDLLFTKEDTADLSNYYCDYKVIGRTAWKAAIVLSRSRWRPLSPRENLYTIGDYNICGLEDSFLTGLYAANQIVRRMRPSPEAVQVASGIDGVSGQVGVEP